MLMLGKLVEVDSMAIGRWRRLEDAVANVPWLLARGGGGNGRCGDNCGWGNAEKTGPSCNIRMRHALVREADGRRVESHAARGHNSVRKAGAACTVGAVSDGCTNTTWGRRLMV